MISVRGLLRFLDVRQHVGEHLVKIGHRLQRQPQSGANPSLGLSVTGSHQAGERYVGDTAVKSVLDDQFCNHGLDGQWIDERYFVSPDLGELNRHFGAHLDTLSLSAEVAAA